MELIKAIEKLNWMKEELKSLDNWIEDLDVYNKPVNGIHWRKLKKAMNNIAEQMQDEIKEMEEKINQVIGGIEVDI